MPDDKFQPRKGETAPKWMTISRMYLTFRFMLSGKRNTIAFGLYGRN